PLGTGLSEDQAALLQRHAPHVILLYDSDDAGLRATFRAGDELLRHKLRVSVATLPEGEDPDTLVGKGGAAALEGILKQAIDVLERKIQILERKGFFGTLAGAARSTRSCRRFGRRPIPSPETSIWRASLRPRESARRPWRRKWRVGW